MKYLNSFFSNSLKSSVKFSITAHLSWDQPPIKSSTVTCGQRFYHIGQHSSNLQLTCILLKTLEVKCIKIFKQKDELASLKQHIESLVHSKMWALSPGQKTSPARWWAFRPCHQIVQIWETMLMCGAVRLQQS